jgi:RecA-family ATPase
MNDSDLSGNTTNSTGNTTNFKYEKQRVNKTTGKSKVIELPTFKTMPIVNAFEEIKDTINNQKNIFGDLLTEGDLTILFGRSNVGKSFLSYQIGEAVARGKNVLNVMDGIELKNHGENKYFNLNNETPAQKVLYVDFEATIEKDYIRYSNKDLKQSDKITTPYQFCTNFITAFPDRLSVTDNLLFIDAIELEIIKTGAKVLIIDNMSAISQDNEKSGNAAKLMNKVKDLQRRNKLTVLLMAHTPKIVQGEAIIANNLAGSSNLYNLADSVMAINMTTMADDIRYIKQLKSRYNEIQFHQDNVVAIQFSTRPDGLKGFSFLNYEAEDELIKHVDKATKEDEDREIINLIVHFGFTAAKIAEELKPKYAPDVEMSTYKERIKKRIQRLRGKGRINENQESVESLSASVVKVPDAPVSSESLPTALKSPSQSPTTLKTPERIPNDENITPVIEQKMLSGETSTERTERILREVGIKSMMVREKEEAEQGWKNLQADILKMKASPVEITDEYNDIPF